MCLCYSDVLIYCAVMVKGRHATGKHCYAGNQKYMQRSCTARDLALPPFLL